MKKTAILYSNYIPVIDVLVNCLENAACFTEIPENIKDFDLVININYNGNTDFNTLKCHRSLLPAFAGEEPIKDAILAGVKVTGITLYFTKPERIVAQYPVFISNETRFDELEKELEYLEQVIFPIAAEKILNNEPVNIKTLQGSGCGGCKGCLR